MSRFVSAGTDQDPTPTTTTTLSSTTPADDDGWAKARQMVESVRAPKPIDPAQQANEGKSLYDVLQANKAAKQEAFEEANKLRNQFRALDDSEIEFLDGVRDSERSKEAAVRRETADQLDLFRKQRAAAEQQAREQELAAGEPGTRGDEKVAGNVVSTSEQGSSDTWAVKRKRRRNEKGDERDVKGEAEGLDAPEAKLRKSSLTHDDENDENPSATGLARSADGKAASGIHHVPKTPITSQHPPMPTKPVAQGLGLAAYGSDSEDE